MKIEQPGIFLDFDVAAYHRDPCPTPSLNQTLCKVLIDQSALHVRCAHPRLAPPPADDDDVEKYVAARVIGEAAHKLLIGRGKVLVEGKWDNWMTKEARAFRNEQTRAGNVPILSKHLAAAHDMVRAAALQISAAAAVEPVLADAFTKGNGEVVAAAEDRGIWLRTLIDWMVSPTILFDFKTTAASVAPHVIPNKMADDGWPIQAAMQERILDLIDPDNAGRRRFFFIAQENYAPHALTVHELPEATMFMGRKMLARGEALWRECMATGQWPGYPAVVHQPQYPGFKETQWLNREIEDHDREQAAKKKSGSVSLADLRSAG